jgi:hypothetical protein
VVALDGVGHFGLIDPAQPAFGAVLSEVESMIAV